MKSRLALQAVFSNYHAKTKNRPRQKAGAVKLMPKLLNNKLFQERKDHLWLLVGLSQHSGSSLSDDLGLAHLGGCRGVISILNTTLSSLQIG